jgi:purine-binding chemotaxis protein CheW
MSRSEMESRDGVLQTVSFMLGAEEFGVDIHKVQEINRMADITRIPEAPSYVAGIVNLRGKIVPVVSLRARFGMEQLAYDKNTRIIVCDTDGLVIGLIVDAVSEVLRIPAETLEEPPAAVRGGGREYLSGIIKLQDRLLLFLDITRLTSELAAQVGDLVGAEAV